MVDLADGGVRAMLRSAAWRKSSYSNPSGDCVEFAPLPAGQVAVRDSRSDGDEVLVFTRAEWAAFLAQLRGGAHRAVSEDSYGRRRMWSFAGY